MAMEQPVILCVDDDLFFLGSLEETLKRNFGKEYIIEGATTGEEALGILEELYQEKVDVPVIISDQAMPDMKGVDLLIRVYQKYPEILTVMLTGQANAEDVGKAVNYANLYRYISKPWEENDLILTVKEAIRSYFQEKNLAETNQILKQLNASLEQKVNERTAELEAAKQEAELANQVKSNFLCMMSHELRTPLSAIIGFSQILMADQSCNKDQSKNVEIIYQNGEHLLVLINDILSMSKIEKGRIALQNRQFDLHRFLNSIQEMMSVRANHKKLNLVLEYDDSLPQYIIADDTKLRQVLIHLIGNSIKFTSSGSVSLKVCFALNPSTQTPQPHWGSYQNILLHFQVEDTGIGIDSKLLKNLFDPFVQIRKGETSEGTGLGLPISHELVQLMGGEIIVETEVGNGSSFEFKIPVETNLPLNASHSLQSWDSVIRLESNQPKYRILILDSIMNYSAIIQNLQAIGFEILVENEKTEGIKLWQYWQPHLIFVQLGLIQDETINAIHTFPEFQSILIAIISENDLSSQPNLSLAGFDDILEYPLSIEKILQKTSQHLGVRYLYSESREVSNHESEKSAILLRKDFANTDSKIEELTVMPSSWIQQFYDSSSQCNERLLHPLIAQIPIEFASQATLLKELIHEFRYDLLLEIANQLLEAKS
jgi:signal transduction histidine kinase